jgi:hypothetical protein
MLVSLSVIKSYSVSEKRAVTTLVSFSGLAVEIVIKNTLSFKLLIYFRVIFLDASSKGGF